MNISVTEAKAQLPDLVRRAAAGEEVILTCDGHPVVRLVPVPAKPVAPDQATRKALLDALSKAGKAKATPGPCAARSQDFLYDEDGLPK